MASSNEDCKTHLLIDLRISRDHIQHFAAETYAVAESAVEELFSNRFSLEKLDELNTILKQCKEKLARVSNSIGPLESLELAPSAVEVS